jgi:hypothetical protein
MAHIFSLRDLDTGIAPRLFPEGRGIGFGTSDGLYAMVISNIHTVRTLEKSHVVRPCQFTLEVINGESQSSGRKGITAHGYSVQPPQSVMNLIYQSCSRL